MGVELFYFGGKERKNVTINFKAAKEDFEKLSQQAKQNNISLSAFIRKKLGVKYLEKN